VIIEPPFEMKIVAERRKMFDKLQFVAASRIRRLAETTTN